MKILLLSAHLSCQNLYGGYTKIKELPKDIKVECCIDFWHGSLEKIPDGLVVKEILDLRYNNISKIPKGLIVYDILYISGNPIWDKAGGDPNVIRKLIQDRGGHVNNIAY